MAEQKELETGIGDEEAIALKPAVVRIEDVKVEPVGEKKLLKAIFYSKHPDSQDLIPISGVKYESKGKLQITGTFYNKDKKDMIRKGSALAVFMQTFGCETLLEFKGKEIPTIQDEKGYLVFKAY
jgi:hypothetical protein